MGIGHRLRAAGRLGVAAKGGPGEDGLKFNRIRAGHAPCLWSRFSIGSRPKGVGPEAGPGVDWPPDLPMPLPLDHPDAPSGSRGPAFESQPTFVTWPASPSRRPRGWLGGTARRGRAPLEEGAGVAAGGPDPCSCAGRAGRPGGSRRAVGVSKRWGSGSAIPEGLFRRDRYLAGTDDERHAELNAAIRDRTSGIFPCRGGYGLMRILERVDYGRSATTRRSSPAIPTSPRSTWRSRSVPG